jgi:hypothetical protein
MQNHTNALKDYLDKCRTIKINGSMQVMPSEMQNRYAESIRLAEQHLWGRYFPPKDTEPKQPKGPLADTEQDLKLRMQMATTANFVGYLIEQCELAKAYQFPELAMRERDTMALDKASKAAKRAAELAKILKDYPYAYAWPVSHSILETGVHLRTTEDDTIDLNGDANIPMGMVGGGPSYSIRLAELLESFSRAVGDGKVSAQNGPFLHRSRYGPLDFPEPKEGRYGETPDKKTALAVFLVFLIRHFTASGRTRWFHGEGMTNEGEAHWELVEALVDDAFPKSSEKRPITQRIVEQFLARNPALEIIGYG